MVEGGVPTVALGDASVASPFTYRGESIKCVPLLLRHGRCTLASILSMYLTMGVNSLFNAFSLSFLALDGIKTSDSLAAVDGLIVASLFFALSRSKPSKQLTGEMPVKSVFSPPLLLCLFTQICVHAVCLTVGWCVVRQYRTEIHNPDDDYAPSCVNTFVFLYNTNMHATSFTANYSGLPFVAPLRDNKMLYRGIVTLIVIVCVCASEVMYDFNELIGLAPLPNIQVRILVCVLLALDFVLSCSISWYIMSFARVLPQRGAHTPVCVEDVDRTTPIDNHTHTDTHTQIKKRLQRESVAD
eukprot:GHVR01014715.1.p1 GENE.GHVR01014715.1~~GHVR01014715.1.p1  ORF type:complete len:299 (+),score=69.86 GHVR01014715.1:515-1411(+)